MTPGSWRHTYLPNAGKLIFPGIILGNRRWYLNGKFLCADVSGLLEAILGNSPRGVTFFLSANEAFV